MVGLIDEVEVGLLNDADELINFSDRGIMALSLGVNVHAGDNYQMAMNIRLRKTIQSLNDSIKKFEKSNRKSSNLMIGLIIILVALTILLLWQMFVPLFG